MKVLFSHARALRQSDVVVLGLAKPGGVVTGVPTPASLLALDAGRLVMVRCVTGADCHSGGEAQPLLVPGLQSKRPGLDIAMWPWDEAPSCPCGERVGACKVQLTVRSGCFADSGNSGGG
jgi:hypothetical protein